MDKKELKRYIKDKAEDFLNCEDKHYKIDDIKLVGFYIELDNIAEIVKPLLSKKHKRNQKYCPFCSEVLAKQDNEGDEYDYNELYHCKECNNNFAIRVGGIIEEWAERTKCKKSNSSNT